MHTLATPVKASFCWLVKRLTSRLSRELHSWNWYFHWSTDTLLVHSTRQLFLTRLAAAMPAPDQCFARLHAVPGTSQEDFEHDSPSLHAPSCRMLAMPRQHTACLSTQHINAQLTPADHTPTRLLPAPQGRTMMPDRARPLPNILDMLFCWNGRSTTPYDGQSRSASTAKDRSVLHADMRCPVARSSAN